MNVSALQVPDIKIRSKLHEPLGESCTFRKDMSASSLREVSMYLVLFPLG